MATQREVAKHVGHDEHTLRRLVKQGVLSGSVQGKQGGWDIELSRLELFRYYRQRVKELEKTAGGIPVPDESLELRTKAEDKLVVERARKEAEMAESLAIKNAQAKRTLIPVDAYRDYCEQTAMVFRSNLEALPGQISIEIPHLRTEEVAIIRRECSRISDEIADFRPRHPGATRSDT